MYVLTKNPWCRSCGCYWRTDLGSIYDDAEIKPRDGDSYDDTLC